MQISRLDIFCGHRQSTNLWRYMEARVEPNASDVSFYAENGFVVARGLFSKQEADAYRAHYFDMRAKKSYKDDWAGEAAGENDPLREYPRMIHMHRWDKISLDWLLDERIRLWLERLCGRTPYAVQTMLYFKPAGARGQALHQDQLFLRVKPGVCMAAWMALEAIDEENGCLRVVPGSHKLPLLCRADADTSVSFTGVGSELPPDIESMPIPMEAGDVLFFDGLLIHGSLPNVSRDRFRATLIGHYIDGNAERVADYYHPVLRMDGSVVALEESPEGGPCGTWVTVDGRAVVEVR